jgi:glucose/arabinose dehydrogenase
MTAGMRFFAGLRSFALPVGLVALVTSGSALCLAQSKKPPVPPPNPPPAAPAALAAKVKLQLVTRDTTEAVGLVAAPGEPVGRLFVVEKQGQVRILRGTKLDPEPFLDLRGQVGLERRDNGEQGLLGLAFHPQFKKNGRFFVNYTDEKGDTRVVELRVNRKTPNKADPTWRRELLFVDQPYANHNAGHLAFGPDGRLYVALGDGGSANDPKGNAQNPDTPLGKLLRFDVDAATPAPEVLSRGMRNPWRYAFDRKTGDLYIADVGQNVYEWVHVLGAGKLSDHNLGWNIKEGKHCFQDKPCDDTGLTVPVIEYPHSEGCSITGGFVYRGKALPELQGHYFFSDYCTAILRSFRWDNGAAADAWDWKEALDPESTLAKVSAFGEDQAGELYVVTHEGPIYKIVRR